jgi:uncharacterized protein YodC (DUF2158 family)
MSSWGFKLGDVVRLKSGSPKMVVEDIGQTGTVLEGKITCVWIPERALAPFKQTFLASSLVSATDDER